MIKHTQKIRRQFADKLFECVWPLKGWKGIKSKLKAMLSTFLDFAYFGSYLQTKETARKQGDAIVSELEMLWSSLDQFWKASLT